jgi:glycosyltransferase involved in cell wall biosynthesis
MVRVLVVATSRKTRGGITSVVRAHELGMQWEKFHCRWIETHRDGSGLIKIWYLLKSLIEYFFILPRYNIVHFHLSEPPSAMRKLVFFLGARLLRKKTICHFHAFSVETTINSKYRWVYKYLFEKADCVIVLSSYWKNELNKKFNLSGKIRVLYNPSTAEILPKAYETKKQILYAGTVNARKGYADMIKAFAKIANMHRDWKIVFAGNGEIKQGKALAENLGISSQTIFLGWVSGTAKDQAFKESSIFCLPSYAEGFPMSVLDAWAYGKPVITTPVGGIPDVAQDGENMLLFNPGDVEHLAKQMELMICSEALRNKIAEASAAMAKEMFSIDSVTKKLGEIYENLINNNINVP